MSKYRTRFRRREAAQREWLARIDADCKRSGHARPIGRRQFLNRGLVAGSATVLLPGALSLATRAANAECVIDNDPALGAGKIPFLAFDQGGGANIAGSNIMVGGAGGQEDFLATEGYEKLGLPNAIAPQSVGVDRSFGLAFHPNSALLRGMLDKTSVATRANVNGVLVPARSENDTGNNPHNPIYGVARAGAAGEFVATIGSRNSQSGGRSAAPQSMISADLRPVRVRNARDAIGLAGGDRGDYPNDQVATTASIISALKLGQITAQEATRELVQCGYDKASATFNSPILPSDLDPEADAVLQEIFPGNELTSGDFTTAAAAMKVVVNGYGGAGTVEYGGRDYHQDPRPETDGKDFIVGQAIGGALEYAARRNQPLMIYGFSDGAVSADTRKPEDDGQGTAKFRWRSDNSQTAASFLLAFSPLGRPALRDSAAGGQLGHFKADGTVDTASSPFANSVTTLAELVVLNYLALHGQQDQFGMVLANPALGTGAAAAPWIAFESIV